MHAKSREVVLAALFFISQLLQLTPSIESVLVGGHGIGKTSYSVDGGAWLEAELALYIVLEGASLLLVNGISAVDEEAAVV